MRAAATEEERRVRSEVASRLVLAWARTGLALSTVAERAGVAPSTLFRYMTGERFPSSLSLMRVCPVLNVSADWVLGIRPARGSVPAGTRLHAEGEES